MNLHREITGFRTNQAERKIKRIGNKTRWRKVFTRGGYTFWRLILSKREIIYNVSKDGAKPNSTGGYYNLAYLLKMKRV